MALSTSKTSPNADRKGGLSVAATGAGAPPLDVIAHICFGAIKPGCYATASSTVIDIAPASTI